MGEASLLSLISRHPYRKRLEWESGSKVKDGRCVGIILSAKANIYWLSGSNCILSIQLLLLLHYIK